ncbi:MAG: hypothetical protein IJ730_02585 [Alphaproteobacteria bacterium]|nr:hypothetical protein [Alphaproteobacteria bacterium]
MQQHKKKTLVRHEAIQRLIQGEDGTELVKYLGDICLRNLGCPCKDPLEYAFNEGKRSVFLAILQMAELNTAEFVRSMVKDNEEEEYF